MLTIPQAVSTRPLKKEDFEYWGNKEAIPVLASLRQAANYNSTTAVAADTNGLSTPTILWTSEDMPDRAVWLIQVQGCAIQKVDVGAGSAHYAYQRWASFYRDRTAPTTATQIVPEQGFNFGDATALLGTSTNAITLSVS
jgi:hypothetical protein